MKSTNNYMNPEEFQRVLDHIPQLNIRKWLDEDIQWLFKICYHCALRMGEAVKLEKKDFDIERREIDLQHMW